MNGKTKHIYALEGTVNAGKTSLMRIVQSKRWGTISIDTVEEYDQYAPQGFPSIPQNYGEAKSALYFFLKLDQLRKDSIEGGDVIVLDRSVLSILAYDYAINKIYPDLLYWDQIRHMVSKQQWIWPSVCVYININDKYIYERQNNKLEKSYNFPFLDPIFNYHIRHFYRTELPTHWPDIELLNLSGELDSLSLSEKLMSHIKNRLT